MTSELYRTAGLPSGFFSQTGNLHMHVDGGGNLDLALNVIRQLELLGLSGKLNLVIDSVAGPQRALLPETYESHTPTAGGEERFEYFSTISIGTRERAIEVLRKMLPLLLSAPGVVVEVERVIARVDDAGHLAFVNLRTLPITVQEVGFSPSQTLPFEIHHAFDMPKEAGGGPKLAELLADCNPLGVEVGGWFSFARTNTLSYRSNAFAEAATVEGKATREHMALNRYLGEHGYQCHVRTVVEEVVGIWRK